MHTILKKEYTCIITRKKYELVKKRAKDRCILLFCIFETKNQKQKQKQKQNWKQCFQKVQPQNDKLYGRLKFPFVFKKRIMPVWYKYKAHVLRS